MAIIDSEKLDFLWKRIIFGVTKTAGAAVKFGSNETISSPLPVMPSQIWTSGDDIESEPPESSTDTILVFTGADAITMLADDTAPVNQTWYGFKMEDCIPPTFGTGYAVKVWVGNPTVKGARIFPDTTGEEWVYDYAAGVLNFVAAIPANKPATVGSGTVSVATDGVSIEVYQYNGAKGFGEGGGGDTPFIPTKLGDLSDVEDGTGTPQEGDVLTYKDGVWQAEPAPAGTGGGDPGDLGTMSLQDADDVAITGGTIDSVTLTNVTIDGGEF